jgi:hypothetical protein
MAIINVTDATLKGQLTGKEYTGPVEEGATYTGDVIYQDAPIPPDPGPDPGPESGWTVFTASNDTKKFYVSASGNDSNDGLSEAKPKKTLSAGIAQLRSGYPDWLLLKRGDVWTNQALNLAKKGRSAAEPMLIDAYGSGNRPRLDFCVDEWTPAADFNNADNVCVVSIEFYAYKRDPANSAYAAGSTSGEKSMATGVNLRGSGSNFTMEDCKISFYRHNFDCIGAYQTPKLHRCVVLDCYDWHQPSSGNTEGVFFSYCKNAILSECIFDSCGWVGSHTPITLSHSGYFRQPNSQGNGTTGPGTMTGCWLSRNAADGGQLRRGGTITKNFSTLHATGFECGHNKDDGEGSAVSTEGNVSDNVITRSQNVGAGRTGHGFVLDSCQGSGVTAQRNIVCNLHENARHTGGGSGALWVQPIYLEKCSSVKVIDNIVFDWPTDDNRGVYDAQSGGGNIMTPNKIDMNGDNSEYHFSDPKRTLAKYYKSIGGTEDEVACINAVRKQAKGAWNDKLTAKAVVNYFRAGFDLAPI